jgi:hypothetical protein
MHVHDGVGDCLRILYTGEVPDAIKAFVFRFRNAIGQRTYAIRWCRKVLTARTAKG